MIRRATINLNDANTNKIANLKLVIEEYSCLVNSYIGILWEKKMFKGTYITPDIQREVPTWLSARLQQCAGKQAFQIVKSQRKNKIKTKPLFEKRTVELDERFCKIDFDPKTRIFDIWLNLTSLGSKLKIILPSHKHYHFNLFKDWIVKKAIRIRQEGEVLFADIFFTKEVPLKTEGRDIGIDCGYKKIAVTSSGQFLGTELPAYISKITKKFRASKGFQRALKTKNEYINKEVKKLKLDNVKNVVVEDLKDVKKYTKKNKTMSSKFMNKLQYWNYKYFLGKLENICEVVGVQLH
ncbi:transposase, IS605 OrfB family, central region, partial [Candidatus Magnetobacterium bavaricum]